MNQILWRATSSLNGSAILEFHLLSLAEVGAACCEHCHGFVNDKTLVARCQILLLTNASKVPCRQVGVNSSSWRSTTPPPPPPPAPLGLIISKKALFPPLRQSRVSIHFYSLQKKNTCSPPLCFWLYSSARRLCVSIGVHRFLSLLIVFTFPDRLKAGSCLVISDLCICDRPLQRADGLV